MAAILSEVSKERETHFINFLDSDVRLPSLGPSALKWSFVTILLHGIPNLPTSFLPL